MQRPAAEVDEESRPDPPTTPEACSWTPPPSIRNEGRSRASQSLRLHRPRKNNGAAPWQCRFPTAVGFPEPLSFRSTPPSPPSPRTGSRKFWPASAGGRRRQPRGPSPHRRNSRPLGARPGPGHQGRNSGNDRSRSLAHGRLRPPDQRRLHRPCLPEGGRPPIRARARTVPDSLGHRRNRVRGRRPD